MGGCTSAKGGCPQTKIDWKQPQFDVLAGLDTKDPYGYSSAEDFQADAKTVSKFDIATYIRLRVKEAQDNGVEGADKFLDRNNQNLTRAGAKFIAENSGRGWDVLKFFEQQNLSIPLLTIGASMIEKIDTYQGYMAQQRKGGATQDGVIEKLEVEGAAKRNSSDLFTRIEEKPQRK